MDRATTTAGARAATSPQAVPARPRTRLLLLRFKVSRAIVILAGITLLALGLRFVRLGSQSLWLDEWLTWGYTQQSARVLAGNLLSNNPIPPLYFASVWLWTKLFGTDEYGLRSLSALAGTLTVPLVYATARVRLAAPAALLAALLVAVNPFSVWFSQEARPYALLALLSTLSLLCLLKVLDGGGRRWLIGWAVAASLALTTHFFALFFVAACGLWLLYRRRDRDVLVALGVVGLVGLAMLSLAFGGTSQVAWVHASAPLLDRLWQVPVQFMTGLYDNQLLTGSMAVRFWVAAALSALALGLAMAWPAVRSRTGAVLAVGLAAVVLPFLLGAIKPSSDYLLPRYVIAAFTPLAVVIAAGLASRRARPVGGIAAVLLAGLFLSMTISIDSRSALQRTDWRTAGRLLGPAPAARAVITTRWVVSWPITYYSKNLSPVWFANDPAWGRPAQARRKLTVSQITLVGSRGTYTLIPPLTRPPLRGFGTGSRRDAGEFVMVTYYASRPVTTTPAALAAGTMRAYGSRLPGFLAPAVFLQRPG